MSECDMNVDYSGRNALLDILDFDNLELVMKNIEVISRFVYERRHDSVICRQIIDSVIGKNRHFFNRY